MNPNADQRPDPDRLLKMVQAEEACEHRGRLKIFLGYASGIGKSFRMLDEGRRRHERGQDVVVGAVQPKLEGDAAAALQSLEVIPLRDVGGVPVVDVAAILKRRPQVCLIDGLAYDNPPGSRRAKRWQDVNDLLDAGISVISSVNLQYIDEYREQVEAITGKRVTQTVPMAFLNTADEIAVVDIPPEFAMQKSRDADMGRSVEDLERMLAELREIALLATADVVDRQLTETLESSGIRETWGTQERILVCLTPRTNAEKIVASARRNVERFHGELFAVSVTQPETSPEEAAALDRKLELARQYGAKIELLDGVDPVETILDFARRHSITQIFVGHSRRRGWLAGLSRTPVDRFLEEADNIDVRVFPQ